jgi:hypothetical protein
MGVDDDEHSISIIKQHSSVKKGSFFGWKKCLQNLNSFATILPFINVDFCEVRSGP